MTEQKRPTQSYDPNEVAQQMFGVPYAKLSAWGQASVDHVIGKMYGLDRKIDGSYNQALPNVQGSLLAENERLGKLVEQLQIENAELWQENEELRQANSPNDSF